MNTTPEEIDGEPGGPLAVLDQTIAAVKAQPGMSMPDFVSLYFAPLVKELVEDYDSQLNDIDDQLVELSDELGGDDDTSAALVAAAELIQKQSILILGLCKAGGLMDENGFTDKAPAEIQAFYAEVSAQSVAFAQQFGGLDDDEGGDEDDEPPAPEDEGGGDEDPDADPAPPPEEDEEQD